MDYDLICIGGGIAGASLGRALALRGARVLIIERETHFRDRVRGEAIHPWGVVEARALGIVDLLLATGGQEVRWWRSSSVTAPEVLERDLIATTPQRAGELTFYHPEMQETLLRAAAEAGAEVRRGATVIGLSPGIHPTVSVQTGGALEAIQARLIAAADGRNSRARGWGGFAVCRDPERLMIAGLLLDNVRLPGDGVRVVSDAAAGRSALFFPLRGGRLRAYAVQHRVGSGRPLSGGRQVPAFLDACVAAGADAAWFAGATAAGPLAAFEGAESWVEYPYRDGVALVGDAAATSDPSWGCGLSMTLRDVRILRDRLLAHDDWAAAGQAYAAEHDRHYAALRRLEHWRMALFAIGAEGDDRRARVLPRLASATPGCTPDLVGLGPDGPSDEATLRHFS